MRSLPTVTSIFPRSVNAQALARQVADHHAEHARRRMQARRRARIDHELHGLAGQQWPRLFDLLVDDVGDEEILPLRLDFAFAREQQERVDHRLHVADRALHPRQRAVYTLGQVRVALHEVAGNADDGQRRAQLVARVAGEIALAMHEQAHALAHALQRTGQLPGFDARRRSEACPARAH
jgi:hypothetical protein